MRKWRTDLLDVGAMESAELLDAIGTKLDQVGVPDIIIPEDIRPVAVPTRERRDLKDLERQLQKIVDSLKGEKRLPRLLLRLANMHLQEGEFARAIILYEMSLGIKSDQVTAWINMGISYLMAMEYDEAIDCFTSAIGNDPKSEMAYIHLATAQLQAGKLEECRLNLDAVLSHNRRNARALYLKGAYFALIGNEQGALMWLTRALKINPNCKPALMEMAKVYVKREEFDKAIQILERSLRIESEQPYVMSLLGDIYRKKKETEQALHWYDRAVAIKFDDPELWTKKGNMHRRLRSFKQASNAYDKAIQADPEFVEAWIKNGLVVLNTEDEAAAMEYFNTALALAPNNPVAAHQRGLMYLKMGRYETALNDFDAAFAVDAGNANHLYHRAVCLEKMGMKEDAKRTWQVARSLYTQAGNSTKAAECAVREKKLS